MIILLGEVGGTEEYKVCDAIKNGEITKPLVAWCIGKIFWHFYISKKLRVHNHY